MNVVFVVVCVCRAEGKKKKQSQKGSVKAGEEINGVDQDIGVCGEESWNIRMEGEGVAVTKG